MAWFGGFTLETYNRIPGDYETLTVGATAIGLSLSKIKPAAATHASPATSPGRLRGAFPPVSSRAVTRSTKPFRIADSGTAHGSSSRRDRS